MNGRNAYLIAFVLAVMVISYNDVHQCHRLPWPPRLIMAGLVFALLDLFALINQELAGVIAIGIVLAVIVNKGYVADCHAFTAGATIQPADSSFLDGSTQPSTGEILA